MISFGFSSHPADLAPPEAHFVGWPSEADHFATGSEVHRADEIERFEVLVNAGTKGGSALLQCAQTQVPNGYRRDWKFSCPPRRYIAFSATALARIIQCAVERFIDSSGCEFHPATCRSSR